MTVAEFDPRQREIDLFLSEGRAPAAPNSREADLAAFLELGAGPPATGAPVASAGPPPAPPFEPAKRPEAVALHSWATIAEAAGRGMTAAEQAQTDPDRPLVKEVIARFARGSTGEPTVQAGAGIQMAGSQLERISALAEFGQAIVDTGKIVEAFGKAEQLSLPRSDAEFFLGVIPTPRTALGAIAEATPQLIAQVGATMALGPAASLPAKLTVFSGTAVGPAVGSQFAEARDYHLANGASEQEAQNRATLEAGIAGTITFATNIIPGIAILRKTPGGNKAVTMTARAITKKFLKSGSAEALQETSEQLLTDSAASVQRDDPTLWKKIVGFDLEYWRGIVTAGVAGFFLGGPAGVGVEVAQDKQGPKPPPAEARVAALELAVTGVPRPARQTAAELGTREGATKLATEQPAVAAKIAEKPTPSRDDVARALAPGEKMSGKQRRALADLLRTEIIAEVEQTQLETTTRGRTTEGGVPRPTVILSRKAQAVINSMPEIDATGEPPTVKQVAKITGSNMQQARRVRGQIIKHLEARAKEAQRAREVPRAEEVVPEEAPRRQPVEGQGVRREGVQRPEDAGFEPGRPAPAPEEPEEELIRTRPAPGRPRTKAVRVLEETSTLDLVTMAGSAVDTTREDIRITPEEARIELERRRAGAANRAVAAGETADEAPAAPEPTTAPKVGDSQSVMGLDSVVEAVETVDDVRFELYGDAAPETGGTIRAVDVESGEPIGMTHYPTAVQAATRFGETVDSARRRGQPADEVAEPTEEEPEEPPSPTEEPTGPTRGPAPTLAPALKTNELGDAPLSAKLIRAAGVTLGKTTKARKLFRVMTEGTTGRDPGTFSQFQQRARWKNHETLRQPLFLLRKKGLARVVGFNEQGKPIYALGTGTRQPQSEIDALAAASTVGMEPALANLEEDQKRRGKQARPAATRPEEETRTPPAEEAKRATGPPKPVVRARLQDVVSKASSELGGDFVEQINQLLEASEDTRAGDAEGHFSIRPEDLEDLSPTLRAAVIKRYSVDEDGGEAVLDVVGQTLYDAAVSEAMMSVGASTDATLDWVIWHAEHLMPEASMSAFLIQAIERSQPGKGPEGRLDPKLYIRVDDLPLGTTFTIFGQEIVVSSEEDVGDVLDAGRVQWPRAAFDEFPIDIGSLRLPPDGGTPAPAAPEPTAPAEKVVREKAFADEIEESTNDFLGASAERLRENYILNNRGLQETGKALSKETDYQDAVQANLRRMGFPNQIVVFRGRHKDRPPPSGEFVNVSFREGVAENFRKATLPEPPPSSKWVVERFVVPRDKVVGVGSAAESELIVRLSDLKAETGIQGRKGVATPAPSAVPARTAKGPSPAKIAAVEKKAPPKWCKDCSTVVIRTITGENVPEPGKGRSFAETVVAVEDAGFKPDYAPTRTWRGKPVRDLGRDAHTDITGFVAVEGHVMPIVDGRISNISGHGDEAITAVVAFRRAAAKPEAGKPKPTAAKLFADAKARIDAREAFAKEHEGEGFRVERPNIEGAYAIVSPEVGKPGKWRTTYFDKKGPSGHSEARDYLDAVKNAEEVGGDLSTASEFTKVATGKLSPEITAQHRAKYKGRSLDNSWSQQDKGFPKMRETLRSWSTEQLHKERQEMLKASFDRQFGHNAKRTLKVIDEVIAERKLLEPAAAPVEPPVVAVEGQPWGMTQAEFTAAGREGLKRAKAEAARVRKIAPGASKRSIHVKAKETELRQNIQTYERGVESDIKQHRREVEAALKEGKPVPHEVLKDYPDLAKPAAAKPEAGKPTAAEPLKAPPVPVSQPGLLGEEFGGGITSTQEGLPFTQPSQLEAEVEAEAKARTKRDKGDETMNLLPDPKGADPRTSTSRRHRGFVSSDVFMLPVKAAQVIGFPLDAVLHLEVMDLIDNVERFGGKEGKRIGEIARETVNRTKTISGRLSHARVRAIRKTNQANLKKGAAWKLQAVDWGRGRRYGMSRFVEALEGRIADEDMTAGELTIIKEMRKLTVATGESLEDVKLLQRSRGQGLKELFGVGEKLFTKTPSGKKFVRLPTYEYYDLLMRGPKAAAFKVLVKAIAEMNNKTTAQVEEVFQQMRADMVAAGDPAFRRIGPEFAREWKRFPTHIRAKGEAPINLLRTNPTGYATQLVSSTAHRAAFVAVIGQDAKDIDKLRAAYGKDGGNVHLLDALFRALNNVPPFMRNAINPPPSPGSPAYLFARFINGIVNLHASAALSAAVIPNLFEPLGNVGPLFGYRRMFQAFVDSMPFNPARKQSIRTLERAGAVTLDIMDFSIDRDRWVSSLVTQLGQVGTRASFLKFINEGQEQMGAIAALRMLADFKAGRGTVEDEHLLRLLKFDKEARKALVSGISNKKLSDDFLQRAARINTGSTATKAETGPLRNRRDFNFFVRFTGYFANTARTMKLHTDEINAAFQTDNTARKRVAVMKMSKFLFGKTLSGVMANFMWAFFLGGPAGVREKWEEAKEDPIQFFFESFIYSVFGGLLGGLLNMAKAESPDDFLRSLSRLAFPVSLGIDYWTMWRGDGAYKNMTVGEKAVRFTQLHTPALRTMPYKALGGVLGMAYMDPKLDVAKRRYWSWRFERSNNARPPNYRSYQQAIGSQRQFKIHMRRAYEAMVKGEDTTPHLLAAFELEGKGFKNIKASLLGRRLLVAREGSITQAQLDKMKSEMTTESWEMLEAHDLLLKETANKFTLAVARGEIQTK